MYGGQGSGWRCRWPKKETRTAAETHTRTRQTYMWPDMHMPVDIRIELRVTGLSVGGHLPAGLQGVQRGHRNGTANVPDDQLDGVQQLRVGVLR